MSSLIARQSRKRSEPLTLCQVLCLESWQQIGASLAVLGGFEYSHVSVVCRYVISSLELLVAEDYMIIYLNGATPRRRMPGISWLKRCYQMIDRRYSCKNHFLPNIQASRLSTACFTVTWCSMDLLFCFTFSRLRKNLKCLIIAHPSWFIRTVLAISRPFIR